jgi:outer membrane protein assembly factor BamB
VCLDARTGKLRWQFVAGARLNLTPTYWEEKLYIGSDDGFAYCLDATTGKIVWKLNAALSDRRLLSYGRMISSWAVRTDVLVDNGIAYFGSGTFPHDGTFLYATDAKTGKLIWRNDTHCEADNQLALVPKNVL